MRRCDQRSQAMWAAAGRMQGQAVGSLKGNGGLRQIAEVRRIAERQRMQTVPCAGADELQPDRVRSLRVKAVSVPTVSRCSVATGDRLAERHQCHPARRCG